MTLNLSIPAQLEALLRERADALGKDPAEYATLLLERELRRQALDQKLEPVREALRQSGLSDEALAEELERVKHAMRAGKSTRKAS